MLTHPVRRAAEEGTASPWPPGSQHKLVCDETNQHRPGVALAGTGARAQDLAAATADQLSAPAPAPLVAGHAHDK